jgi:hypothetical protein
MISRWESDGCLPQAWTSRAYMNVALGACATSGVCSSTSSSSTNIQQATDGSMFLYILYIIFFGEGNAVRERDQGKIKKRERGKWREREGRERGSISI